MRLLGVDYGQRRSGLALGEHGRCQELQVNPCFSVSVSAFESNFFEAILTGG